MKKAFLKVGEFPQEVEFKKTQSVSRTGRRIPGEPRPVPTQLMVKYLNKWRRVYRPYGGSQRYIMFEGRIIGVRIRGDEWSNKYDKQN